MTTNTSTNALRAIYSDLQDVLGNLRQHIDNGKLDDAWFKNTEGALDAVVDDIHWDYGPEYLIERGEDTPPDFMATRATISSCYRLLGAIRYAVIASKDPDTMPAAATAAEFLNFMAELTGGSK